MLSLAYLIASSLFIMLASLLGLLFVWKRLGNILERNLSFLVSFSAGVFLIIAYHLAEETLELSNSLLWGLFWIFFGASLIWLIFKFMPNFHHHHEPVEVDHCHDCLDVRRVLLSDAIHNVGDGLLLAAAFSLGPNFGFLATVNIFIHELVQEISEFFVLRRGGFSLYRSLSLNFLVSSTILLGAIGGYFLLDSFSLLQVPLFGLAAGSFLVVVLHDLLPHSVRHSRSERLYVRHLFWFLLGLLLMFSATAWLGH